MSPEEDEIARDCTERGALPGADESWPEHVRAPDHDEQVPTFTLPWWGWRKAESVDTPLRGVSGD